MINLKETYFSILYIKQLNAIPFGGTITTG
jgi:hypothetical protein